MYFFKTFNFKKKKKKVPRVVFFWIKHGIFFFFLVQNGNMVDNFFIECGLFFIRFFVSNFYQFKILTHFLWFRDKDKFIKLRPRLRERNGIEWKGIKKIILEYSSLPLFGSFNEGNGKLIPLFGSLSGRK